MSSFLSAAGKQEWRRHWPVVASAMLPYMFSMVHVAAIGIMVAPLEKEFGWSRAQITSGLLIIALIGLPLSPLLGRVIDRFGPRRIALFGVAFYSAALAGLSLAAPPIWIWWLLWTFLALAFLCITPTVWVTAVSSMFSASRGLALAVMLTAAGVTVLITPITTYVMVQHFGWRMAFVAWGCLIAVICLPLLYFFFHSAKDQPRRASVAATGGVTPPALSGLLVRRGLRSVMFVKIAFVAVTMTIVFAGSLINLVPMLTSFGFDPAAAAGVAGLTGITQVLGRLGNGYLLDRFDARIVGAIVVMLPVPAFLLFILYAHSVVAVIAAALLVGLSTGAETDVLSYISSRLFGLRNLGTFFGIIVGFMLLGNGLGPFLANLLYDFSGSYIPALWIGIPLCLASSYCFASLGAYPDFSEGDVAAAATS